MGQIKRLIRFSGKFLCDRKYRNHVLDVINKHVTAEKSKDSKVSIDIKNAQRIAGKKVFLIGACELTYFKDALSNLGMMTYHTFDHGEAADPSTECQNPGSKIWSFNPDYIIFSQVQIFRSIIQKLQTKGLQYSGSEQISDLETMINNYETAIKKIRERLSSPIFLLTYPIEYKPIYGFHEYKSFKKSLSLIELIRTYELKLYSLARAHNGVYVLDIDLALEKNGKSEGIQQDTANGIYEHFSRSGAAEVAKHLLSQIQIIEPDIKRVKCAVFDLDETLYSGILSEDGPSGVAVRTTYLGVMTLLAARGIILAVCSKNDPSQLRCLPALLGEGLFSKIAAIKLNWDPKSQNLIAIAKELNIGLDSLALFDNDPFERSEVNANAPEVMVFSGDDIPSALTRPEFIPFGEITAEGASRSEKYIQQAKREEAAKNFLTGSSYEDFLIDSKLILTIRRPYKEELSRVCEVLQRANQLNTALARTSPEELEKIYRDQKKYKIYGASLADKFGDYGLIGVCILEERMPSRKIIELAFSCRVMGRQVEHAFLNHIARSAFQEHTEEISIEAARTDRNQQILRILQQLHFEIADKPDKNNNVFLSKTLNRDVISACNYPIWFKVYEE